MLDQPIDNSIVVPEDEGTGLPTDSADWISAGHIGALLAQENLTNHVEDGITFSPNFNTNTLTVSSGLAYLRYDTRVRVQNQRGEYANNWNQGIGFAIQINEQTGIELTDDTINHVYLYTDLQQNNGTSILVYTDDEHSTDTIPQPALKIGEVDTTVDTYAELHRGASLHTDSITGPLTNDKTLTNIEGTGMFIDANGSLTTDDSNEELVVTTPDGTTEYRIGVDNSGNITTTEV